jgi:hypothetical protein
MTISNPTQLVDAYKKSGEFDRLRRELLASFQNGVRMAHSRSPSRLRLFICIAGRDKLIHEPRRGHRAEEAGLRSAAAIHAAGDRPQGTSAGA